MVLGCKVGVQLDEGGNTLRTLDSAGVIDPKVKNGLNTKGVGRGPLVEIGGNKFGKLKLEDMRVVEGRGPLVEIGGNKFGKLKLEDTGIVVWRGPLVEIGGNKFGKLKL